MHWSKLRARFWIDSAFGAITGTLCLLTLVWRDWIEIVFRFDPDHHSGSVEWVIVGVLAACSVAAGSLARREWRTVAYAGG